MVGMAFDTRSGFSPSLENALVRLSRPLGPGVPVTGGAAARRPSMPGTAPETLPKSAGLSRDLARPKMDPAAPAVCVGFAPPNAFPRELMKSALMPGMLGTLGTCDSPSHARHRIPTRATHASTLCFMFYSFRPGRLSVLSPDTPEP